MIKVLSIPVEIARGAAEGGHGYHRDGFLCVLAESWPYKNWDLQARLVLKRESDGSFWRVDHFFDLGNSYFYNEDPEVEFYRVVQKEVIRYEYEEAK